MVIAKRQETAAQKRIRTGAGGRIVECDAPARGLELLSLPASITLGADHFVVLRRLRVDDADAIVQFACKLPEHDLLFLRRDITDQAEVASWIRDALAGHTPTIVALLESEVVGYVLVDSERVPWAKHVAEVRLMVAPERRGRGLGTLLLSQAVALARAKGLTRLVAQMTYAQSRALSVFARFGFVHEANLPDRVIDQRGELHSVRILGLELEAFEPPQSAMVEAAREADAKTVRWHGPGELLDPNGIVVADVEAKLWKMELPGRPARWGGELGLQAQVGPPWLGELPPTELRLANGRRGSVGSLGAVRCTASLVDVKQTAQLVGFGDAPF